MILNGILAEYEDNLPGGFNNPMSEDEIKIETERRKRRLLLVRIGIWVVFIAILTILAWLYWNRGV
jgi:cytoskeletal protein RodZ